jgi:hypothetical protein
MMNDTPRISIFGNVVLSETASDIIWILVGIVFVFFLLYVGCSVLNKLFRRGE